MSVIVAEEYDFQELGFGQRHTQPCFQCGGSCTYPFLHWDGREQKLFICSACCSEIKRGLMADMTQVGIMAGLIKLRDVVLSQASLKKRQSIS
jgi:hypothetical protein